MADVQDSVFSVEGQCGGEGSVFFYHLAQANLIKLSSQTVLDPDTSAFAGTPLGEIATTPYTLSKYLPESKVGGAFFCTNIIAMSLGFLGMPSVLANYDKNIITLRGPSKSSRFSLMEPSMSPIDTFGIDTKIDDSKPLSGKMLNDTYLLGPGRILWGATAGATVCAFGGADALDARTNLQRPILDRRRLHYLPADICLVT